MRIAIAGAGRMGAWLAVQLASDHEVAVYDRDSARVKALRNVVHLSGASEVGRHRPDFFINAVTLRHTVPAFKEVDPYLEGGCIIADVASVKHEVALYYGKSGRPFVSVHPMFGPTFADMERIRGENAVIITESSPRGARLFEDLFHRLGCTIFRYSFEEHDRMMAYSLTIPFVSSMIFASCVDVSAVPGTTFKRHMDIARNLLSEDDQLLSEILFNSHSITELSKITSRLEFLKHIIKDRDQEEATRFFARLRENIGEP